MDESELAALLSNADTLPYYITEALTRVRVPVDFEHLTEIDSLELNSRVWASARFRDVWLAWLDEEHTFKLVASSDLKKRIQGVVRVGEVKRAEFVGLTLRDSLLESAPANRKQATAQIYSGVGNALIARLIVESYCQDAKGQLLIRPVSGSLPFYEHLGFQQVRHTNYYVLSAAKAQAWLTRYFGL